MASRANIYIDQGTDFRFSVELFDATDAELGIETYDFFASMRKVYSSPIIANFNIEKSGNDITLVLTDEQTILLKPGKYQFDVMMRKTSGELSKVVEGLAFVVPTISGV
tara:strand:- start:451 stop:777 length:327 start_codon:yes stop_codon:yes gene_type:complete